METTTTTMIMVAVMVAASLAMASGQGVSSECSDQFLRSCRETNTTAGFKSCCNTLGGFFVTDQPCLCSLLQLLNLTDSSAITFLKGCGINTGSSGLTCSKLSGSPSTPSSFDSPASDSPSSMNPPPPQQSYDPSNLDPIQTSSTSSSKSSSVPAVVGAVVGSVVGLCLLVVVLILLRRKKKPSTIGEPYNSHLNSPHVDHVVGVPQLHVVGSSPSIFTYDKLVKATDGFSDNNFLGKGGFGFVHKGILPNGEEVAVKQLKSGSWQGDSEFQAEIEIISRVHHKHLVSLVGHCITKETKLLVYEFLPNKTLEFHLHENGQKSMDWSKRMKIALGSAKGLAYLHEDCHPKIIHRDIKAANILLDFKFEAKVADFGLAKFCFDGNSHVSTRVVGTFGYLAPEYAATGQVTEKSDVFSFGIMLLELITGQRPTNKPNPSMGASMLNWAMPLMIQALEDGDYDALADQQLRKRYNSDEMARMVACAATCVHQLAHLRPRISQVVRILEGDISIEDLNQGWKPGERLFYGSPASSNHDSCRYKVGKKKFRKTLNPEEYTSSEYSGFTSEYDRNTTGSSSEV